MVDVSAYPWSSIAKLNNSIGGSCTAVAIEQNKVLTAGHCIYNRRTGRFLAPSSLHLLFGYQKGDFTVHALVENYTIGSGYDPVKEVATISSDWALLTLTKLLPDNIQPLKIVDQIPLPGSQLMIGNYAGRRLHVMTADRNCQLLAIAPTAFLFTHNCQAPPGSSGAPLLILSGENAFVIGIQVATKCCIGPPIEIAISAPSISKQTNSR